MRGDKKEKRRLIPRRKVSISQLILVLGAAFQVLASKIFISSSVTFPQYQRVAAFTSFSPSTKRNQRGKRDCSCFPQQSFASLSIVSTSMTSRYSGNKDNLSMDDNQAQSRRNPEQQQRQQQKQKHPRRHEATTDAAPVYITIGKIILS